MKKISNENLNKNLQIILNKREENITKEDLLKVNSLNFTKMNKEGNQVYLIEELLSFENLENLTIENSSISFWDIRVLASLANLKSINFQHCFFEKEVQNILHYIKGIENLSLRNCYIEDYSRMFNKLNLTVLEIIFPYNDAIIHINSLSNLVNLKTLTLEGCIISNETEFVNLKKIEILYLISTEINDLSFINNMNNLKKIYLSSKYVNGFVNNNSKVNILTSGIDLVIDDEKKSRGII